MICLSGSLKFNKEYKIPENLTVLDIWVVQQYKDRVFQAVYNAYDWNVFVYV